RSLILIGDAGWHQGVVGIIAGRIAERFQRPAVVLGSPGQRGPQGSLSGSARSVRGFDLKGSLDQCAELLLRHGGHREAAGLAVLETQLSVLHDRLDALARDCLGEDSALCREADAETQLSDLNWGLFGEIGTLAPFGVKNRPPRFLCRRVRGALHAFGREQLHLKLRFDDPGLDLREAIWWNHGHLLSELGRGPFDLIGVLERDEWQGERRLRLRLEALRVHRAEAP
ncbi:MAG: DHHA1 domain-containing protein, partial [Myxococcota bacterium]|nr:DHHA1 domain-containing protein [Myxococcota bacterium]